MKSLNIQFLFDIQGNVSVHEVFGALKAQEFQLYFTSIFPMAFLDLEYENLFYDFSIL